MAYPTAEQQETIDVLSAAHSDLIELKSIELTSKPYGNIIILWSKGKYRYRATIIEPDGTFTTYHLDSLDNITDA